MRTLENVIYLGVGAAAGVAMDFALQGSQGPDPEWGDFGSRVFLDTVGVLGVGGGLKVCSYCVRSYVDSLRSDGKSYFERMFD
jgi:hypothetical protein